MDKFDVLLTSIATLTVDAIVNAANSSLMGGGGVDGAIHRAGGPAILEECKKLVARQGRCKTGNAVATTAGKLKAKIVIHTVGPVWHGGQDGEARLLAACYRNSLKVAVENNCKTVAFPCISTGVYGYPVKDAANVAVRTVKEFIAGKQQIEKVTFACFDQANFDAISEQLAAS